MGCPLVSIKERVVHHNREAKCCRLVGEIWIQILTFECHAGLRDGREKGGEIAHSGGAASLLDDAAVQLEDLLAGLGGPSEEVFEASPGEFLGAQAKPGCEGLQSPGLVFLEGNGDFSHVNTFAYCTSAFTNRQDEQA